MPKKREKEVLNKNIRKTKQAKLVVDLKQEKEDITSHLKAVESIGDVTCPKDFHCYKSNYNELCNAAFKGTSGIFSAQFKNNYI